MIEFGARLSLKDNMYATMQKNLKMQRQFTEQVEQTRASVKGLGNAKASPTITANDKASGVIQSVKKGVAMVGSMFASPEVGVEDRASKKVDAILEKIKQVKKTVVNPVIRLKDNISSSIAKIKQRLKDISKTITPVVKVKDLASKIISKIKNTLGGITKKVFSPFVKLKDGASKALNSIKAGLKSVGSMVAKPMIAVKDMATAGLEKIKSLVSTLAKGATIAVTAVVGGALGAGANMEQSIGGVETLFGSDAGVVMANADKAYKTAGLSANAYMEQVTSFSASLLQSLGGDTAKSAMIADMAMIDMADNANKFGTDMESIQNAYQGFAKQNYTMLDNLKLGYGGTQEEMQRLLKDAQKLTGINYDISNLSDVYSAINAIQKNMGVAGTTVEEAERSFSGSFASMKASAQNLLANLALGGDITGSMEQLMDSASTFLYNNAIPMVGRIITALPEAIKVGISKASPKIKEAGKAIVESLKAGMIAILPSSMSGTVDPLFDSIGKGVKGAVGGIKSILGTFGSVIKNSLGSVIPVVTNIFNTVSNVFDAVVPSMQGYIQSLGAVFQAVMPIINSVVTVFGQVVSTVFPIIYNAISVALNAVIPIINALSSVIQTAMPIVSNVISVVAGIIQSVMPVISQIFTEVGAKIGEVITTVVVPVMNTLQKIFEKVSPVIQSAVEIIMQVVSVAWSVISPIIDLAMVLFETLWNVLDPIITALVDGFTWLWDVLEPVFSGIANGLSIVGDAIGGVADFIGSGIDTVAGWFGFAYGKDRVPYDNYPAVLHQGEKVLTRNQADQYERMVSTRGVQLTEIATVGSGGNRSENVPSTPMQSDQKVELKVEVNNSFAGANFNNLGDLREVGIQLTDIVVENMVKKMEKVQVNMA